MRVDKNFKTCNKFSFQNLQNPDSEPRMLKEHQSSSSSSSFVLFPNPNPLMRSFNIPEPIIHPPGITPYSFLNPKPHADDKLKPMTSLDVDPCTTLRTEIITNTTDLTESEHATSGPQVQSSNSGTEKAEDELNVGTLLWCEVCKVNCNSEKKLVEHNLGKKHQKNLKTSENLRTPPLTTPTASMATTPVPKPMKKTGDSEEGKLGWCEVCKIDCRGYSFSRHVRGKKHRENLRESKKMTGLPSTDIDPVIIQPNDPVENPNLTTGKVVNPDEGSSTRCEVSIDEFNRRISGKRHEKTQKLHGRVAERLLQEEGKSVILETGKRKANGSLADEKEADAKRKKMVTEGGPSGASISCKVCNVTCNSVVEFTDHLAGQEHSAMALKQVKALIT
ncbi:hypothetical protein L1887_11288 [Cichorium endivia]|nr:hypothetical protein L1887_11288 [Cichorium endivia]